MRIPKCVGIVLLLLAAFPITGHAQNLGARILAAKVFVGKCDAACKTNPNGPWGPGSVIRWRIGVANIGNTPATQCVINDLLPPGFTYAGDPKYFYGATGSTLNASTPSCCMLTSAVPAQVGGVINQQPVVGAGNLTWKFPLLPFQNAGPANYFIIEFDVRVGTVLPGKYCNTFTFSAVARLLLGASDNVETVRAESNAAQVTITGPGGAGSGTPPGGGTNPFLTGIRGNYYPTTTWSYLTDRTRSVNVPASQTNIRVDGAFTTYRNFWKYTGAGAGWRRFTPGWQWVETVTKKGVNGLTLETSDVLGRHNALLTGYRNKLVVAEAGNARINEILFDGFEDWNYVPVAAYCDTVQQCVPRIVDWGGVFVQDAGESHTGRYSGRLVGAGKKIVIPTTLVVSETEVTETNTKGDVTLKVGRADSTPPRCAGTFKPTAGMKYVLSAWVRDGADPLAITFAGPAVQVGSTAFHTRGNIIDGWQQIYGELSIPSGAASVTIAFLAGAGGTWFDDIRIFPYDGRMITYVYDGNTQDLTYTLDENNYYTKYNYSASKSLESINKETEKGVLTVKEARSANVVGP